MASPTNLKRYMLKTARDTIGATPSIAPKLNPNSVGLLQKRSKPVIAKTVDWYLDNQAWCKNITSGNYARERLGTAS